MILDSGMWNITLLSRGCKPRIISEKGDIPTNTAISLRRLFPAWALWNNLYHLSEKKIEIKFLTKTYNVAAEWTELHPRHASHANGRHFELKYESIPIHLVKYYEIKCHIAGHHCVTLAWQRLFSFPTFFKFCFIDQWFYNHKQRGQTKHKHCLRPKFGRA